jgi:hypothetical protein
MATKGRAADQGRAADKDKSDKKADLDAVEVTLADVGGTVGRLARSHRRSSLILIVLLILVGAASAGQIAMLNTRLANLETGLSRGSGRSSDDLARIQDQTAKMGAALELLHRDLAQVHSQLNQITRELRPQSNE